MKLATTLVHKGAMDIAVHAVESFSRNFAGMGYRLEIHTDGSPDESDERELLARAGSMPASIIRLADREAELRQRLAPYPLTAALVARRGYFTKLELPMYLKPPYFYFDSDIVWLRPADRLVPPDGGNVFSTETWSWYYGVCKDHEWLANGTPRRVNSGFYHLATDFPFAKMERMLEQGLFDPGIPYNTDQEIMAYLYPEMVHYHIDDMKRSRVGAVYNLASESCIALHFPGGMWRSHLDQIRALHDEPLRATGHVRFSPSVRLSRFELFRMRAFMSLSKSELLRRPLYFFRDMRKALMTIRKP